MNKTIRYIDSLLDMETQLSRARLLTVRGNKAMSGESVQPKITIRPHPGLAFMSSAVQQIKLALKARNIPLKRGHRTNARYQAKIT